MYNMLSSTVSIRNMFVLQSLQSLSHLKLILITYNTTVGDYIREDEKKTSLTKLLEKKISGANYNANKLIVFKFQRQNGTVN